MKPVLCVDRGCGIVYARIQIASTIGIQKKTKEERKIKKVMQIDEFEGQCGYSYRHEPFCNGGHNCRHPEAAKEVVKGEEVGFCYAFSCPLAPCADEQDFEEAGENLEEYEEDMYVVLFEEGDAVCEYKNIVFVQGCKQLQDAE